MCIKMHLCVVRSGYPVSWLSFGVGISYHAYNRLFSLGANFPEFSEWSRNLEIYAGLFL